MTTAMMGVENIIATLQDIQGRLDKLSGRYADHLNMRKILKDAIETKSDRN